MKLYELLLETTSDDTALLYLARFINGIYIEPNNDESINLGKIGLYIDELPDNIKNILGDKLNNIDIILDRKSKLDKDIRSTQSISNTSRETGVQGYWQPTGDFEDESIGPIEGAIHLNADRLGELKYTKSIAHELRHALDDAKSNNKASDSFRYTEPRKKEHQNDEFRYLASPAEINARLTEIMEIMNRAIPIIYKLPPERIRPRVLQEINSLLEKFDISNLFPEKEKSSDYKRLVSRLMQFVDNQMKTFEQNPNRSNPTKFATGNW